MPGKKIRLLQQYLHHAIFRSSRLMPALQAVHGREYAYCHSENAGPDMSCAQHCHPAPKSVLYNKKYAGGVLIW